MRICEAMGNSLARQYGGFAAHIQSGITNLKIFLISCWWRSKFAIVKGSPFLEEITKVVRSLKSLGSMMNVYGSIILCLVFNRVAITACWIRGGGDF
ncbi:hypothetical protein KSS87_014318 [Heliosperma pusillum]|nr:hypothetical protein KSS87_014318 [Heliosperma pusillum]